LPDSKEKNKEIKIKDLQENKMGLGNIQNWREKVFWNEKIEE
jgi:hypothetical protein